MCVMNPKAACTCSHTRYTLTHHKHVHLHAILHVHTCTYHPCYMLCAYTHHTLPQHTQTCTYTHTMCLYVHTYHAILHPLKCSSKYMYTPWIPPSNTSCLHRQTQDIHTNTDPTYRVSPTLSLPPGPLESPTVLSSPLRQITWEKRVANKGAI